MLKNVIVSFAAIILFYSLIAFSSGCAQISMPTGGVRDTIAPVLIKATPGNGTTNFTGNRIQLNFDEYIDLKEVQQNVLVSPLQKNNPIISYNFRTVNIRLRDTLLPNTTYSIQFGNAITDLNEGNPFPDFVYTFSTGDAIDSMSVQGKVILAETGLTDSTLMVLLYRNASDTAVLSKRPDYITKVRGDGTFEFNNLPPDRFHIYALKDGDGGKTYNSKTEIFAFIDSQITVTQTTPPVLLHAYAEEESAGQGRQLSLKPAVEKRLRVTNNLESNQQDLHTPLELTFNNPVMTFLAEQVRLMDTSFRPVPGTTFTFDSTRKKLTIRTPWKPATGYELVLPKDAITDSAGNTIARSDTISFTTKSESDYGALLIRFKGLDLSMRPVIQFVQGDDIKFTAPLTSNEWQNKLFVPGEYDIRILYDENNNGIWDPGNFRQGKQPEKAITLPQKIQIRANWDNERDISL